MTLAHSTVDCGLCDLLAGWLAGWPTGCCSLLANHRSGGFIWRRSRFDAHARASAGRFYYSPDHEVGERVRQQVVAELRRRQSSPNVFGRPRRGGCDWLGFGLSLTKGLCAILPRNLLTNPPTRSWLKSLAALVAGKRERERESGTTNSRRRQSKTIK